MDGDLGSSRRVENAAATALRMIFFMDVCMCWWECWMGVDYLLVVVCNM